MKQKTTKNLLEFFRDNPYDMPDEDEIAPMSYQEFLDKAKEIFSADSPRPIAFHAKAEAAAFFLGCSPEEARERGVPLGGDWYAYNTGSKEGADDSR